MKYAFGMHTIYGALGGILFGEFLVPSPDHPQWLSLLGSCAYVWLTWDSIKTKAKEDESRTGR
jgi:hypothetical protein